MEDNEFYDSLEEDDSPEPLSLHNSTDGSDISQTVPLYRGETSKSDILRQRSTRSHHPRGKLTLPSNDTTSTSTSSLSQLFLERRKKKSYVDLFHAKIGYVQGSEPTDTTRALCDEDNFQTARSFDLSDAESTALSFVSDSSSFYNRFLENEKLLTDKLSSISCRSNVTCTSNEPPKAKSVTSINKNNTGKSTQNLTSMTRVSLTKLPKKRVEKAMLKVPTLGGLGPDREATREKLERLKRQQCYGQKVSNQNRMKIMEMKVMNNFKYELKKASDLNKAESVLSS